MTKEKVCVFKKFYHGWRGEFVSFGFRVLEVLGLFVVPYKFQF